MKCLGRLNLLTLIARLPRRSYRPICQQLLRASLDRRAGLAADRELLCEDLEDWREDLSLEEDAEGVKGLEARIATGSARLQDVRLQEWVRRVSISPSGLEDRVWCT